MQSTEIKEPLPATRIFIVGGSNSLFSDGWVERYAALKDDPVENLSVGATTTLTGLYRLMLEKSVNKGDVVIWEYALNEVNHVVHGQSLRIILKNVEHFIRYCRRRGLRLLPVILTPRKQELAERRHRYFVRLENLFRHYGIEYYDVSSAWRSAHDLPCMPGDHYQDNAHYRRDGEVVDFLASGVAGIEPKLIRARKFLYTGKKRVRLMTDFADDMFRNSIMTVPAAKLPLTIDLRGSGRIIAIMAIAHPSPTQSGLDLSLTSRIGKPVRVAVSTSAAGSFPKPILKAISIEQASKKEWIFGAGDTLLVRGMSKGGRVFAESRMRRRLKAPEDVPGPAVAGVMIEVAGPARTSPSARPRRRKRPTAKRPVSPDEPAPQAL